MSFIAQNLETQKKGGHARRPLKGNEKESRDTGPPRLPTQIERHYEGGNRIPPPSNGMRGAPSEKRKRRPEGGILSKGDGSKSP